MAKRKSPDDLRPLPPEIFYDMTPQDLFEMMDNDDCLTPRFMARYYAHMDIQNPPPNQKIKVWFDLADIERMIRATKK